MTHTGGGSLPPKLPPYPEHFAASSVGTQVETAAGAWRKASGSLLAEVAAAEAVLADRLAQQDVRAATRQRLRSLAKGARR